MKKFIGIITACSLAISCSSAFAETVINNITSTTTGTVGQIKVTTNVNGHEVVSVYKDGVFSTETSKANETEISAEADIKAEVSAKPLAEEKAEIKAETEAADDATFKPSDELMKWLKPFFKDCIREILNETEIKNTGTETAETGATDETEFKPSEKFMKWFKPFVREVLFEIEVENAKADAPAPLEDVDTATAASDAE